MLNYLLASEISWVYIVFGIVLLTTMSIYVVIMAYNNAILTNKLTQKVLTSNVFFPMGIVAVIGKIIGSFYLEYDDIYIWNQDIKYVFIVIIVAVLLNSLLEKLHDQDSLAKAGTKTKSSVPAMGSGAGSKESSPESDDADGKNKSRWEKVKNFCYNHRVEIAVGVVHLVIFSIIVYAQYKKATTPPENPWNSKEDIDAFRNSPFNVSKAYLEAHTEVKSFILSIQESENEFEDEKFANKRNQVVNVIDTLRFYDTSETSIKVGIPLILDSIVSRVSWLQSQYIIESDSNISKELKAIELGANECLTLLTRDTCMLKEIFKLANVISLYPTQLWYIFRNLQDTKVNI
jgi:hypothetical protein